MGPKACVEADELPTLQSYDVFRVTIDATARTLTIQRRVPSAPIEMPVGLGRKCSKCP